MREETRQVEGKLENVADGCGMGVLGRRIGGLGKFGDGNGREGWDDRESRLGRAARVRALEGCVVVVGRLLRGRMGEKDSGKKGKILVVTAKVLVLSRLLVKSLSDGANAGTADDDVADMKRKLGSLRRRLLRAIERRLDNLTSGRDDLLEALCGYSLATNSGAKDVLRHFLSVRGQAISTALEIEEEGSLHKEVDPEAVGKALKLLAKTLVDVQAIAPRRLSEALLNLKSKHLFEDDSFKELEGLRLDICQQHFGDEILSFTPYIRHDDLDGPSAASFLTSWSKRATEILLEGLGKILEAVVDFSVITTLRTDVLKIWITEGGKARGFDSEVMVDGLRKVVNERALAMVDARVSKLHLVDNEAESALQNIISGVVASQVSLWDEELVAMDITRGGSRFKEAVIERVHGRSDAVSRVVRSYQAWKHFVDEMASAISQLRTQRWNDDLDSLEDDEVLDARQKALSSEDPELLMGRLRSSLEGSFKTLQSQFEKHILKFAESERKGDAAVFILRVLRDIRSELLSHSELSWFGLVIIPELHQALAHHASEKPLSTYLKALKTRKRVVGRSLWEGEPELPVYPSAPTFKFLYDTSSSMAEVGNDLWSATAVSVFKKHVSEQLSKEVKENMEPLFAEPASAPAPTPAKEEDGAEAEDEDGEESKPSEEESKKKAEAANAKKKDLLTQSLFDTMVLKLCLAASVEHSGLDKLEDKLKSKTALEASILDRLLKSANEYHKRTALLLGPLA